MTSEDRNVVLVVADDTDTTADGVCAELAEREVAFFRFDTSEFPGRSQLAVRLDPGGQPAWAGRLRHAGPCGAAAGLTEVELSRVISVYLRRPRPFEVPAHLSVPERWHAATECRYGLGGVLASLPVPQVNHPSRSADAAYKPRQIADLRACGLKVPTTLVTNDGAAVRAFAAEHGDLICKGMAVTTLHVGNTAHTAYTRRVTSTDLDALGQSGSGIEYAAHLFQPFIASAYAVRAIVVGERVFAVRIDAHSERARTDWRSDYDNLSYQATTLPAEVIAGVRSYMSRAGLHYGAWDFLGHADGTLTCLEINAEGNYAWLEDVTPLRITAAIAEFLADPLAPSDATASQVSLRGDAAQAERARRRMVP